MAGAAPTASGCCFPRQYAANQGIMKATVQGGHFSIMYGNMYYWFDAVRRMETYLEDLTVDGVESRVTVIKDYNVTNTKYVIANDKCRKMSLTPFKEGCIPDWATKLVDSHFADAATGQRIQIHNTSAGSATSFLVSSPDGCFPIYDLSAVPTGSAPYMQAVQFYNFTLGIQDPSVFDIPAICQDSSVLG
ncbi:hypothetical protein MAR_029459 [Mya arenaria]|uniref:Ependymin n=2 Tax=Mya arenaria TaxID=6604 RepID=A0ABY7DJV5_MYAAR|nr:hypothetical protein MAR_029459 [Mya arenaria]